MRQQWDSAWNRLQGQWVAQRDSWGLPGGICQPSTAHWAPEGTLPGTPVTTASSSGHRALQKKTLSCSQKKIFFYSKI